MGILEHALAAARRGWHVFPITAERKQPPLVKDWERAATTEEAAIREWFSQWPDANYGIACGPSGLFVVDADTKENGLDTLADLELTGLLPCTLEIQTPSGGRHLYFTGNGRTTARKIGRGLDTRSGGGYVVGPGSSVDGRRYSILADRGPVAAPAELIARTNSSVGTDDYPTLDARDLDLPQNLKRAADYLKGTAPAIEGQGGNDWTYRTATLIRDFGVSEGACLDLLVAHFNPRCLPPWSPDELQTIVSNAYEYARRETGARAADPTALDHLATIAEKFLALAENKQPPDPRKPAGRFKVLGWQDVMAMPDPKWIVQDTLTEQGLMLIYGPMGSYKSFVTLDMALHISLGQSWCGRETVQGPVLYVAGEGAFGIRKRVKAWAVNQNLDSLPDFGMVASMPIFGDDEELRQFAEEAAAFKPRLIVFDTVAHAMAGMDENAQKDSGLFVARCNQLARALGASIALVHHTGKDQSRGARGSTVLPGACDTILEVRQPRPLEVLISMTKQKDAEAWQKPLGLAATVVEGSLVFAPADVTASLEDMTGAVYSRTATELLEAWPEELLPVETSVLANAIAEDMGTRNTRAVRDYLRRTGSKAGELQSYICARTSAGAATQWTRPKY